MNEIYLDSRSPRRLELLQQMGIACKTVLLREETNRQRDVDETPLSSENPCIYVERMAKMKAEIGVLRAKQRAGDVGGHATDYSGNNVASRWVSNFRCWAYASA